MTDIRRIDMRKIRDVLRLHLKGGLSQRQIAAALGISKGVVAKYITLATQLGLGWDDIVQLSETALERRLIPPTPPPEYFVRPDFGQLHHEMRRKGMTIMLLWQEFMEHHPGERVHQYSQFSVNYRHYVQSLKRSLRMVHRAGEKLFIDFAGPTIKLTDGTKAHIYVAALGASSYTFAYATPRETMADWLWATAKALDFFGGVPQLIVPDNPKAMISQPDRYEPKLSATVQDFARHYGCSILPARPRHPQDKAKVESAVQVVERWIMMRLRHQRFETVDEVNAAIGPCWSTSTQGRFKSCQAAERLRLHSLMRLPCSPCRRRAGSLRSSNLFAFTSISMWSLRATATACPPLWYGRKGAGQRSYAFATAMATAS